MWFRSLGTPPSLRREDLSDSIALFDRAYADTFVLEPFAATVLRHAEAMEAGSLRALADSLPTAPESVDLEQAAQDLAHLGFLRLCDD